MLIVELLILFSQEVVADRLPALLDPAPKVTLVFAPGPDALTSAGLWSWLSTLEGPLVASPVDDGREEVRGALRRLRDAETSVDDAVLALTASGTAQLSFFFDTLATSEIAGGEEERAQRLSERQREALYLTLAELPRDAVLAELQRWIEEDPAGELPASGIPVRRVGWLEVLGAVGKDEELLGFLNWAGTQEVDLERLERERMRRVIGRIVPRCDRAFDILEREWTGLQPGYLRAALEAAGDSDDERALAWLRTVLAWQDDQAALVLPLIPRIVGDSPEEDATELVEVVAEHLDPSRPNVCSAACQALGALEDPASARRLVDLLEAEAEAVQVAAHLALKRISRTELPRSAKLWRHWLTLEEAWYAGERSEELAAVSSGRLSLCVSALKSLREHTLYRHELGPVIADQIAQLSGTPARLACSAVARLGSRRAVPGLAYAAIHSANDPGFAHAALESLLGIELPEAPEELMRLLAEQEPGV